MKLYSQNTTFNLQNIKIYIALLCFLFTLGLDLVYSRNHVNCERISL